MNKKGIFPYVAIILSVSFWGFSYLSTAVCLRYMQPVTLAMLRCIIAAAILMVIWKLKEKNTKVNPKHLPRLILSGFVGIVCYFVCEIYGVKYTSPALAAIILAAIPVMSLIIQRVSGRESLTLFKILGVIMSLAGVAAVMGIGFEKIEMTGKLIGYVFMLGAALSWVVFNYITFPLYEHYSPLAITSVQMTSGAVSLIAIFLFTGEGMPVINLELGSHLLFLAVFCSAIGILLYMYAFKSLGMVTTTLFINIQPIITVIASMIILKEYLRPNEIIGGILVVAAVYLSTYRKRDLPLAEQAEQTENHT
ncbi:MAG: DMT family transporter [Clostridia bacterium]|nr:DMT family transporter [Clostridia bacterium]